MKNKAKLFMIIGISVLLLAVIGSTLAYYVWVTSSAQETKITTSIGSAYVYFDGGSSIENAKLRPVSDKSKGVTKTISVKSNVSGIKWNLYLDLVSLPDELKEESFKYALYNGSSVVKEGNFSSASITSNTSNCTVNNTTHITLVNNASVSTSTTTYTLYIWIDGANYENPMDMMNKSFSFKLHANGTGAMIQEGKIPDITQTISNSFANQLVSKYIASNKTDVTNNGIVYHYDETNKLMSDVNGNLRYYGASPNNYIYFNCSDYSNQSSSTCETWRIIGVFEGKVKLIRGSQIGKYAWDNKNTSTGAETAYGKNDWTDARLMKLLNPGYESETTGGSLYYKSKSGNCYSGQNNATTTCNFTSTGIKNAETRNLISDTTYYLGGWDSTSVYPNQIYEYERGTKVYSERPTTWPGKIALPYPSDYGYAADLGKCRNKQLSAYDDSTCTSNNWMNTIIAPNNGWLLTPYSGDARDAWYVYSSGYVVNGRYTYSAYGVAPVLSLNSELAVKAGTGSSSAPYQLSA